MVTWPFFLRAGEVPEKYSNSREQGPRGIHIMNITRSRILFVSVFATLIQSVPVSSVLAAET